MVEQATLSISIDASDATRGAREFSRAADEIKRKAAEMNRVLDRGSAAFRNMRSAVNDNSQALTASMQTLRGTESALRGLSDAAAAAGNQLRNVQQSATDSGSFFDRFGDKIRGFTDLIIEVGVELGVSAKTMSIVVTAIEGLIAAFEGFKLFKWIRDSALLASTLARLAPILTAVAETVAGVATVVVASPLAPFIVAIGLAAGGVIAFLKVTEEARDRQDRFNGSLEQAKELARQAATLSGDAARAKLEEQRARLLNAQAAEKEKLALLRQNETQIRTEITQGFGDIVGNDPLAEVKAKGLDIKGLRKRQDDLRRVMGLIQDTNAIIESLGEQAMSVVPPEKIRSDAVTPTAAPRSEQNANASDITSRRDDSRVRQLIEETTRSIELLNEQNRLLKEGDTAAADRKGTEAEIRERILQLNLKEGSQKALELEQLLLEKNRLEQVNKSLNENAELRARTQDDTAKTEARAAALDDLAQKLKSSGLSADEMQAEIDLLNRALDAGIDLTKDYGQKWLAAQRRLHGAEQAIENVRTAEQRRQGAEDAAAEERRKRAQDTKNEEERRADAVKASMDQIRSAAKDAFKDIIKGTESVGDAFKKLADRITDILLNLALDELLNPKNTGFSDLFGTIFGSIGSIFGASDFSAGAATSAASLSRATAAGAFTTYRPTGGAFGFHTGGIVGLDGTPRLAAANFNGAPRYHGGGIAGLAADEVPIIARRGEEVLTRHDPRHRDNLGSGGGAGGNVVVNVSFPNARNTAEARQAGSEIAAKTAAAAQRGMARKGLG